MVTPIGLVDKLYWRQTFTRGHYHCFKKTDGGEYRYMSLCGKAELKRSGGQACKRPPATYRCPTCDNREMKRREKDESLPESKDWRN